MLILCRILCEFRLSELAAHAKIANAVPVFLASSAHRVRFSSVFLCFSARGRGKSAALGLAISAAVAFSYSNIFVTSPSPENLKTLFDFVFKGFDALEYQVCFVFE